MYQPFCFHVPMKLKLLIYMQIFDKSFFMLIDFPFRSNLIAIERLDSQRLNLIIVQAFSIRRKMSKKC